MDRNTSTVSSAGTTGVALRKESVDRNKLQGTFGNAKRVALRKESVDRNAVCLALLAILGCRSPQGERG